MTHHVNWNDIHTGHNVCDRNGEVIGSVADVRQMGRALGGGQGMGGQYGESQRPAGSMGERGTPGQGTSGGPMSSSQGHLECNSNLPGLNKLYIPLNAFTDCDGNCCRLNVAKDEISRQGWDRQPSNF